MLNRYTRTDKLIMASGVIGTLLESFDVMICAFLAQQLSATFFSSASPMKNLFYTFNIFLIGYLSRPIGGILLGLYADHVGRKKTLILSICMVGFSTAIIGFIPSYQSIGVISSILFLIFRVLQNLSVGGEYISSIAYLVESAPSNKRGFFSCWVSIGFNSGTLLASLTVLLFLYSIDLGILPEWSWRVIFLFSLAGILVGFWIRYSLPESIAFILENSSSAPKNKMDILKNTLTFIKSYPVQCISILIISWLGACETSAIFVYSPIFMTTVGHFSQQDALTINTLSLILLIFLIPLFGILSDRINRTTLLILATTSFLLLSYPYFHCLSHGTYFQILLFKLIFSIPSACFYAVAPVFISEVFPVKLRCTTLACIYQIAASLAGGLSPLIMMAARKPSTLLLASAIFGIIALFTLKRNPIFNTASSRTQKLAEFAPQSL